MSSPESKKKIVIQASALEPESKSQERKKVEEKEAKERLKAEEREQKKAEKLKKGGDISDNEKKYDT